MSATERSRKSLLLFMTASLVLFVSQVLAQPPSELRMPALRAMPKTKPEVSEADIELATRRHRAISDEDGARAAQRFRSPSDEELARVPVPGQVNVDALPSPTPPTKDEPRGVNLADIARDYDALRGSAATAGMEALKPTLLVFISFAMPMPTLERLVAQAQAFGATVLLRGLVNNSLLETAKRCQVLIGQRQVTIQIDPQSFERFSIAQTPTFVLLKPGHALASSLGEVHDAGEGAPGGACITACINASDFVSIRGDVSIDFALNAIAERAPAFGASARLLLRRSSRSSP